MIIPSNIIANADDFGCTNSINKAILYCYQQGYINSTSLMVNTDFLAEAVEFAHKNPVISNIGIHVNLTEGKPVTNFNQPGLLDENGNWDSKKVNKKYNYLNSETKAAFSAEIHAQVNKGLSNKLAITHLDSHHHIHTLPGFYKLFAEAARKYNLKIRLAQTYSEGNYLKFYLRKYINSRFKSAVGNYSDYFETVEYFLKNRKTDSKVIEVMLHPYFDNEGRLIDHYTESAMQDWISFLNKKQQ